RSFFSTMLTAYASSPHGLRRAALPGDQTPGPEIAWIDLLRPTGEEESAAEGVLGINVPTGDDMHEVAIWSRLYEEDGTLFMTATLLAGTESPHPEWGAVTFILTGNRLVTVRYVEPHSFKLFLAKTERHPSLCASGQGVLLGLLETIVDRMADMQERVREEV